MDGIFLDESVAKKTLPIPFDDYQKLSNTIHGLNADLDDQKISIDDAMICPSLKSTKHEQVYSLLFETHILPACDIFWVKQSLQVVEQIIKDHVIDAVYASFAPIASLELGYQISRKYNIPLITEFRDGLVFDPLIISHTKHMALFIQLEKKYCQAAKKIITVGNTLSNYFKRQYAPIPCDTVFNGFEPNDFPTISRKKHKSHVSFATFGKFSLSKSSINIDRLMTAIQRICTANGTFVSFNFIGELSEKEVSMIGQLASNTRSTIAISPHVNKSEGLAFLSDHIDYMIFLGVENEPTIISSKLFDFINLGIPIIGICKGNEAEQLIQETQTGETCSFSADDITRLLEKAVQKNIHFNPLRIKINQYTRENQAKRLESMLLPLLQ
jgi:hypothetical protein